MNSFITWLANFVYALVTLVLKPFPATIAGVNKTTIATFARRGIQNLGSRYVLIALVILIILFILKKLGFLNTGNIPHQSKEKKESVLNGKNIIFLGSSVTKGFASQGVSFADMIGKEYGANIVKEAVSGTTLVDKKSLLGESYISRLKQINSDTPCDLFVCQLSTNDATKKYPLQEIETAIREIIDYARNTWKCPVVFYTNPQYASKEYGEMIQALKGIAAEKKISVIDLWDNESVNQKTVKKFSCMNDQIHPTKKGYKVWLPVIAEGLENALTGKELSLPKELSNVEATRKAASIHPVKSILKWVLAVILAIGCACGVAGYKTLCDTTGLNKPGNHSRYNPENQTVLADSPLKGKTILFLGSSVTQGYASQGISYVDYIEHIDQCNVIKEVMGATTVANIPGMMGEGTSYNPRLRKYDHTTAVDAVVIQLSSNDSTAGSDLGELSNGFDITQIDDTTFTGGMESLIAYCKQEWNCPVLVYSNPAFRGKSLYNSAAYAAMKDKMTTIAEKWDVDYLNLWDDPDCNAVPDKQFFRWMSDTVHPTKQGYLEWWTPIFQQRLYPYFQ
ncbi:MAG: SGNH/GDSL hydrolase family protein [Solobacterium sp.]|nr:SGNH/GDSL hydrolase family protein [Solobacterium sp.]